jgi:hypothetical protein
MSIQFWLKTRCDTEAVSEMVVGDGSPAPEAVPEMVLKVEEMMVATSVVAPSSPHETTTGGPAASPDPADVAGNRRWLWDTPPSMRPVMSPLMR